MKSINVEHKKIFTGSFFLKLVTRILIIACCIMVLYPLIWYLYSSVKSSNDFMKDAWSLPGSLHFENYKDAINNTQLFDYDGNQVSILKLLANTLFTSLLGTGLLVIMSSSIAFILCKYSFKGKKFFKAFFLMAMVIPSRASRSRPRAREISKGSSARSTAPMALPKSRI